MLTLSCLLVLLAVVFAAVGLAKGGPWTAVAVLLLAIGELLHCVPLK